MKNLHPTTDHIKRTTDNFRYENFFATELEAFDDAKERSSKITRTVYVMTDGTKFQTNVHGILLIGWKYVARFKKGLKLD